MEYRAYILNFKANGQYFNMGGFGGGWFPPQGGNGGEFRKNKKYASWVLRQRTGVPNLTQTQAFLDCLRFGESLGGGISPPGGERRGVSKKNSKKYAKWVLCQRTCVPNLTQIQPFLECSKSGESLGREKPVSQSVSEWVSQWDYRI